MYLCFAHAGQHILSPKAYTHLSFAPLPPLILFNCWEEEPRICVNLELPQSLHKAHDCFPLPCNSVGLITNAVAWEEGNEPHAFSYPKVTVFFFVPSR